MGARCKGTFLLILITVCIFTSVVPMVDQPETAFNEIDTPMNQTTPLAPWAKFSLPSLVPIIVPRSFNLAIDGRKPVESTTFPTHGHLIPLPDLLCTLLI